MEDRTVNIILITKRFGGVQNMKEHIAKYMSEECVCDIKVYTEPVLFSIVKCAFFDYLCSASPRRAVICMREFFDAHHYEKDLDRMLMALGMVQVAERVGGYLQYIDGWHDTELTKKIDSGSWT